ncbi:proprotein convertase P-domain-containing protein [Peribacillus butanolivorans]|uniref:proprotein convertase P-domain-containing protein n=1 Tax=Peribacillus butanolivorans TaxID=421767 RepID=UPI0036623CF5
MSFPNTPPEGINPIEGLDAGQIALLLLASIAFEELGLAHVINAEAEKLQGAIGTLVDANGDPINPFIQAGSLAELLATNREVEKMLRTVIKKEMLLEFKFENVLDLLATLPTCTPTTSTFSNPASITIPDEGPSSPYPSTINVTGLTGTIAKVTATLHNLSHTHLNDLEILLVGPGGQNVILMDDVGDSAPGVVNATYTFDDASPNSMNAVTIPPSGTYKPSNNGSLENLPAPAPQQPPSYGTLLSVFNGTNPNGTWSLFVNDDAAIDSGSIADGWSLTITTTCP